jgi:hypothetical protein
MIYRITFRSNPRVVLPFLIMIALPGLGIVAIFAWIPIAGVLIALVGGFISYNFFKLVRSILASRIETSDEGVSFDFGKGHTDEFVWEDITHAGEFTEPPNKRAFFVYNEADDKLITVPCEYADFDTLISEVRSGVGEIFEKIDIGTSISINEYLRAKIAPEEVALSDDSDAELTDDGADYDGHDDQRDNAANAIDESTEPE